MIPQEAATGPSRRRQSNNGGSAYSTYMVRPYQGFFEVIGRTAVEGTSTMMLPEDFVRKYGDELSDTAKISVPHGSVWNLGFKKRNGSIWFDDGWQEFVRYHSIQYGYYLAFTYKGMSNFKVRIYKVDGCEISYSRDHHHEEEEEEKEEDRPIMKNNNYHGHDDYVDRRGRRHRPNVEKEEDDGDDDDSVEVVETKRGSSSKRKTPSSRQKQLPRCTSSDEDLRAEACNKSHHKRSKLQGKSSRHAMMTEDHVVDEHDLKHAIFAEKEARGVTEENMLLMKRLGEEGIITNERFLSTLYEMPHGSRKAVHEAIAMKPKTPCFLVFMKSINIFHTRVYIPAKFMKKYMSPTPETIRIVAPAVDGKSAMEEQEERGWTVSVTVQDRGGLTLTKGFVDFVKDSRIRMEDVCVFELISSFPFVFKVIIVRGGSAAE